jgi:hypothetical protein
MDHLHRNDAAAAEALIERARSSNPLGAHVALGNLRADQMRNEEALAAFDAALELEPSDVSARWSRSLVLLRMGNFGEGFEEFEHRAGSIVASASRMLAGPDWNPNAGQLDKRLLLYAEQGLGDTIQFVRLAKVLQQRGHDVALLPPQSLERLCRTLDPNIAVLRADRPLSPHDAHCSLMSLPAKLGLDLNSIPAPVPYLSVDAEMLAQWRSRLSALPAPRVGLCWSGSKTHNNDAQRSIPFAQLEPLSTAPGISFVSLVKDVRPSDASALVAQTNVVDLMADVADFYDTAGLISALDLVVTVDTSIAHLAGALGKPVWVLLPFAPDWRWLTDREDSPWYPTARLFRQPGAGAWQPVLERVAAELAAVAARR